MSEKQSTTFSAVKINKKHNLTLHTFRFSWNNSERFLSNVRANARPFLPTNSCVNYLRHFVDGAKIVRWVYWCKDLRNFLLDTLLTHQKKGSAFQYLIQMKY